MEKVTVYAPASIGNVSVGFDVLGAALSPIDGALLGDTVSVELSDQAGCQIACIGRFVDKLPADPKNNIVYGCYQAFAAALIAEGGQPQPVRMTLEKHLPIGSGLGSSAASIVAAFAALNIFHGKPFSDDRILRLMGELEGQISGAVHYDNVAPCYLGGLQLMLERPGQVSASLPLFENWYWVSAYPGITVSTAEARAILPKHYSRADVINHGRNIATFIHALYAGDAQLAADLLVDVVAEPYRKQLIPRFDAMKTAMQELGALAVGISGSGPSIFAVAPTLAAAQAMEQWLKQSFLQNERGFAHVCHIDTQGTRVVE